MFERFFPALFESANLAFDQGFPAVPDYDPIRYRGTDPDRFDVVFRRDCHDLLGLSGRNQYTRRPFVEQQQFGPQFGIEIDLRADRRRARMKIRL